MTDIAIEVNDESLNNNPAIDKSGSGSEKSTISLLDISDLALLRVFSYLNLRDTINFAKTCVRLSKVGEMNSTKYKQFDLLKYEHFVYVHEDHYNRYAYRDDDTEEEDSDAEEIEVPEPIDVEEVLSHIGKHIKTLSIDSTWRSTEQAVIKNCVNVTSLKIYERYDCSSEWKTWIEKLNLESLTIQDWDGFTQLSGGLSALTELIFAEENRGIELMDLLNILEKTPALETLKVELYYTDFKYEIFEKLPKLRCLDIKITTEDLVKLTEFLNFEVLTQFKLFLPLFIGDDGKGLKLLNSFLEILAAKGNINELGLYVSHVDQNTFRALNLFHLTSLQFYTIIFVDHCLMHDCCTIKELVKQQPNLKNLDFLKNFLTIEHMILVINNLKKLETLTFWMDMEDLEQLNESKIDEILKTSTSRPMLRLYINSLERDSVEITLWFDQRKHKIMRSDNGHKAEDLYYLTDKFTGQVCCQ